MMLTIEIEQERTKFYKLIDYANKFMNVTDKTQGKYKLDAFNETKLRLTDSINIKLSRNSTESCNFTGKCGYFRK